MIKEPQVFVDQQGNHLEYVLYGGGKDYLICFPGFGETLDVFENLSQYLAGYTLVSVNLYFVGNSQRVAPGSYLKHHEWRDTFGQFISKLNIDRFSVLGYSLGGRFAISTFFSFDNRMDHLLLVAADGIIQRFTYSFATFPIGMRQLFKYLMKNPVWLNKSISILHRLKLVNSFTAKFTLSQLAGKEDRMRVYHSWVAFRYLRITQAKLVTMLNRTKCQTTLIFGEKDQIINPKRHLQFLNKLKSSQVLVLSYGHNKLVDNSSHVIQEILNGDKKKGDFLKSPNKNYPI